MIWTEFQTKRLISVDCFMSSFEKNLDSNFVFNGEMHDFWEMMYVEKGSVCVSGDERVYNLNENDIIFHKPMELHKFHANCESRIFVMSFSLSGELVDKLSCLTQTLSDIQKANLYNIIDTFKNHELDTHNIYYSFLGSFEKYPLLINQISCATEFFLLSICEDLSPLAAQSGSFDAEIFKSTVINMENRVTENISVNDFATMQNISTSYLKKIFIKYAGIGVHKYFLRTKITYACKLLKDGKSVFDVSDLLSFSSPNYFCMAFKREMGITPSQFRSQKLV